MVEEQSPIELSELKSLAAAGFGSLVKAVVDISKGVMVVDAALHADEEAFLLSRDSKQHDLWGINLYPDVMGEDWIEFDSMINLRPSQNNNSRGVEDQKIQSRIREIVESLVIK